MKTTENKQKIKSSLLSSIVKVGKSRQVAIPKRVYDKMELSPGDYLEIEVKGDQLVLTPKVFIEKRLAEGLKDIRKGKVSDSFSSAEEAIKSLRS